MPKDKTPTIDARGAHMLQTASLSSLQLIVHGDACHVGWHTNLETGEPLEFDPYKSIALIHSEVSEATEGIRKDIMDDHLPLRKMEEVELADTIIRILDHAGARGLDIAAAVADKIVYNRQRADHKVENRRKPGGKKC